MKTITFMTSLLTFYIKGEIVFEPNFIRFKIPNTILTLIPLGAKKDSIPTGQISSVGSSFKLDFKNFLVGVIEAIIAFALFGSGSGGGVFAGLILLLIGAATIINSMQTLLTVESTSGKTILIFFLIFEKSKAEEAERYIGQLVSNRQDDTNARMAAQYSTNAIVNAIQGQPQFGQPMQQQYAQPMQQQYAQPMQQQYAQPMQQQYAQPMQAAPAPSPAPAPAGDAWFCPNCGNQNVGNFCAKCGTPKP